MIGGREDKRPKYPCSRCGLSFHEEELRDIHGAKACMLCRIKIEDEEEQKVRDAGGDRKRARHGADPAQGRLF